MLSFRNIITFIVLAMLASCSFRCVGGKLQQVGGPESCQEKCDNDFKACKESIKPDNTDGLNQCQKWLNECVAKCNPPQQ
jgi:hypothetical protein